MTEPDLAELDEQALADFVTGQRWYASKSREVAGARIIEAVPLRSGRRSCFVSLVEIRFQPGTHETYQLLIALAPPGDDVPGAEIGRLRGSTVYEGLDDPIITREMMLLMAAEAERAGSEGMIELRLAEALPGLPRGSLEARPLNVEQSNSSVVIDDALILKVYRRLEAGINPELELLRFLTAHGFTNIAALRGWYEYRGRPLDATLGILQDYVEGGSDGWSLALDGISSGPDGVLAHAGRLGEVTATMHTVLASDASDPNFAPEEASFESLGILVASVGDEIDRVFSTLPDGIDALEPIRGRGEETRDQLRALARGGSLGHTIRQHGDYHLGQVLWTGSDWIVVDFEGEPARSLAERRQKHSPLRDVAGMLRSFAYVSSAARILRDVDAPPGFELMLRERFLAAYMAGVDPNLLPAGDEATARLLAVFELEKAVYELRYELDNRPEWIAIPVGSIERLLEAGAA